MPDEEYPQTPPPPYRVAGLPGEYEPRFRLVHGEVLHVGLVDLPDQNLVVGQHGALHFRLHHLALRLELQLLRLRHPTEPNGWRTDTFHH